jgi:hypothetical protein
MIIYPLIWIGSSICLIVSYISLQDESKESDLTFKFIYNIFGPRFHTFVIPFVNLTFY